MALFATSKTSLSLEIFSSARARPSGYLVRSAPDASARNSLLLETASCMRLAINGVRMARIMPMTINKPPPESLFLLPPHHRFLKKRSDRKAIIPTRIDTTARSLVSKFFICESSWAMTPSSSLRSSFCSIPVVAQTMACFGSRPVAKALGAVSSMT